MRIVVQRVASASVTVGEEVAGAIEQGLCLLIGINRYDTMEVARKLAKKVLSLRLWECDGKGWQKNVTEINGGILAVSQFTLYGNTEKGSKPDFHEAMKTDDARKFFDDVVQLFKETYPTGLIQTGAFGQMMKVSIVNDGPVTIILDSGNSSKLAM